MIRHLIYLCLSILLLSTMVIVKLWIVPFALGNLFPQTDLVSKLYEVFIMVVGGLTFLLFIILGYSGKRVFDFALGSHFILHFFSQIPFIVHAFLQQTWQTEKDIGFLHIFAEGWCGLIAEPTRLLFMVYPWTDVLAILLSFLFLSIGRTINIVDEDLSWMNKRVKEGRV